VSRGCRGEANHPSSSLRAVAKQSTKQGRAGLLRRFAPRNDVDPPPSSLRTQGPITPGVSFIERHPLHCRNERTLRGSLRSQGQRLDATPHSRDTLRPRFTNSSAPQKKRAQGRPGARCTRGLACKADKKRRTRAYRFSGNTPAFPAQWFTAYSVLSPARPELVCHRHPQEARASQELDTCHWGVRTTRLCRPLQPRSSVAAIASIASHRAFVTCATPLLSGGTHGIGR
jgi:hypothetical protein